MGSLARWWLRRNPCFECGGEGLTVLTPWVELRLAVPIWAEMTGWAGCYEVTNDPFSTADERTWLCPYCGDEDSLYKPYDEFFDADD